MKVLVGLVSAVVLVTGGIFGAGCGGGDEPLTAQEVSEQTQDATLLLVGRSNTAAATSGVSGIQYSCSAWLYDAEQGLVVTNAHCIGAPQIQVGQDSTSLRGASVVAVDTEHDLAMVRIPPLPTDVEELPLAAAAPAQGDTVFTLGYPSNGSNTNLSIPYQATEGTVSAVEGVQLTVGYDAFESLWEGARIQNDNSGVVLNDLTQTTASTTHGGSGGPVVNDQGEVVGVTVAGTGEANQNDAVSYSTLSTVLPQLEAGTSNAYIGISLSAVPTDVANAFGVDGFLLVGSIVRNSPIDQQTDQASFLSFATRKGYYVAVTEVNGQPVETQQQLVNTLSAVTSGQEVRLTEYAISFDNFDSVSLGTVRFTAP